LEEGIKEEVVAEISGVDKITIEVESALITEVQILSAEVATGVVTLTLRISNHNLQEESKT
jgi:hypothetical protein